MEDFYSNMFYWSFPLPLQLKFHTCDLWTYWISIATMVHDDIDDSIKGVKDSN